jgi:ribosome recycling factor
MAKALFDLNDIKRRMKASVDSYKHDLNSLRTGRASATLLDPIVVEAYGATMPISQVATVTAPEARLLSVQVWDKSMVQPTEKAIRESSLGLNPQTEGQVIRIRIPELTQDRRKEMVKVGHKYTEAAKVAVRFVRRDGLDVLKAQEKEKTMSEDEVKRNTDVVQKETDNTIAEIDKMLAAKEKEIMTL